MTQGGAAMVLLPESDQSEDDEYREFFGLSTGEVYKFSLPLLRGRRRAASSHGWLITKRTDLLFHLLNPFTMVQIALPNFATMQSLRMRWSVHGNYFTGQRI